MKKIFLFLTCFFVCVSTQASLGSLGSNPSNEIAVNAKRYTVASVYAMSAKEFGEMTGRRMKWKDRISFSIMKRQLRKEIKNGNGDKDIAPVLAQMMQESKFHFNTTGFLLGLFLGIFGVALAYIFSRDRDVHTSSWIGFGVLAIVALILIFSMFPTHKY